MIQRVAARDDVAQEVAFRIADSLRPWRIILFGSRARGNAKTSSDYDFYIEIDVPDRDGLRAVLDQIHDLFTGARSDYDFKVALRGDLERRRDDPGTIEWDVAREGKVLYADSAATTDIAPAARVREPAPEIPESVHEWLDQAKHDLEHRELLRQQADRAYSADICWYSHQTCEKYMKALLVARRVRPPRTHKLTRLLNALRKAGLPLKGLDADCKLLTKHAITPRYPAGRKLSADDARVASDAADRVVSAVRENLPRP